MRRDSEIQELVRVRYPALLRAGALLTGDARLGEDLVQTALARLWVAWPRLRDPGAAEAYVRQTMAREALRQRRRRRRLAELERLATMRDPAEDPAGAVDDALVIRHALAMLPAAQRVVLVLRYFEDWPESQIAAVLGCSPGTVKSRAARGIRALQRAGLLDPDQESVPDRSERP
jgi:RNA polymerase sigma-70 factor (sigma-E family)